MTRGTQCLGSPSQRMREAKDDSHRDITKVTASRGSTPNRNDEIDRASCRGLARPMTTPRDHASRAAKHSAITLALVAPSAMRTKSRGVAGPSSR